MNILLAVDEEHVASNLEKYLSASGDMGNYFSKITRVENIDDLIKFLKEDIYHFIVAEYFFDDVDIWRIAKLIHSEQLVKHSIPFYLISDTCELEIPLLLAKDYGIKLSQLNDLAITLQRDFLASKIEDFPRGKRQSEKQTVLIIEDDENAAHINKHALIDFYDIDIAYNGEHGLELWKEKRHNLVLLDYMLPCMRGDTVLVRIMEIDKNQPVIVMTAFDHPDRNKNLILNGASDYLCKPVEINLLRQLSAEVLKRAKLVYMISYFVNKNKMLKHIVLELSQHLDNDDLLNARTCMEKIMSYSSGDITDDECMEFDQLAEKP